VITSAELRRLQGALHPLDQPPQGPGWNGEELAGLLVGNQAPVEAAVLVGLVHRPPGLQVLLTRRTDALRHHAGQVSFPGGRLESGDVDAAAAAIRETGEEIGLAPEQLQPLGYLDPLATITGFRVVPLVAAVAADYVARPDPREVAELFEVPLAYLLEPANLRHNAVDFGGRPRMVLEFVDRGVPGQRIWGATAAILFNLRQRLEGI